jgi:hypothetical protein
VPNAILGGAQVQLSAFDRLSPLASLGNVYAVDGGYAKSPLGGSLVRTRSRLEIDASLLTDVPIPVTLSDAAPVKTPAPAVAPAAAVILPTEEVTSNVGGAGDSGDSGE